MTSHGWLVNTDTCRIPDVDPYDASILEFIKDPGSLKCAGRRSLTYHRGRHLYYLNVSKSIKMCYYSRLIRMKYSDVNVYYSNTLTNITKAMQLVDDEFVRVNCTDTSGKTIYTNLHAFVIPKDDPKRIEIHTVSQKNKREAEKPMNVVLFGIDSVSRLNSIRQLKRIRGLLKGMPNAVELMGYNKVADNTLVNVVPLLTGKYLEELPWNETMSGEPFDKYNFIWKEFKKAGYMTLYGEDDPDINAFNYFKRGFMYPPTDHYFRPFALGMQDEEDLWNTDKNCFGDKTEMEILIQYLEDFITTYRKTPHFAFTFLSKLTHYSITGAGLYDHVVYTFLKDLINNNLLTNTVLILFSDHGMRYGEIRNTFIGKLEERLPVAFIMVPIVFKNMYPSFMKNLRTNAHRLTTPFDLYATMVHIANFKNSSSRISSGRSISLFDEIPVNRDCEVASIKPHWCTCMNQKPLSVVDPAVQKSADSLLADINRRTAALRSQCVEFNIKRIFGASVLLSNDNVLRFDSIVNDVINRTITYGDAVVATIDIQLTIEVEPGAATFEGTIRHMTDNSEIRVLEISRTNKYGHDADCIKNADVKKFCYCKSVN